MNWTTAAASSAPTRELIVQSSQLHSQTPSATSPRRLLFFSLEDWNEVWRRNQFVCAELARRNREVSILWICPVVDISHSLIRRQLDQLSSIHLAPHAVPGHEQILSIKPIRFLPNKLGRGFNNWLISETVRGALQKLDWQSYDVWVNAHNARQYLPLPGANKLIYDITDDWTKMPQPEHHRLATIEDDAALLRDADHVIVCSRQLYQSKEGHTRALTLIANGVDDHRYHPQQLSKLETPADLAGIKKPVLGYTGTLHSARLDITLLTNVADQLPETSLVFVGPNCLTADEMRSLSKPNIHILGSRSYEELPRYIARFDACMTPHLVNEFTESLDPLKLYEYMSTGKPIISTNCAGFRDMGDLITIVENADQFCQAAKEVLAAPDQQRAAKRIEWAHNQSWSARVSQIEAILGWQN